MSGEGGGRDGTLDVRREAAALRLLADLRARWLRQTVQYSCSVRLYQEQVGGRRAARRGLPGRQSHGPHDLDVPLEAPASRGRGRCGGAVRGIGGAHPGLRAPPPTARQREIADLIAQGLTNGEIAARIVVSRGTVGNHRLHAAPGAKNRRDRGLGIRTARSSRRAAERARLSGRGRIAAARVEHDETRRVCTRRVS